MRRRDLLDSPRWPYVCALIFALGVVVPKELGDRLDTWRYTPAVEARDCR